MWSGDLDRLLNRCDDEARICAGFESWSGRLGLLEK